MLLTIGREIGVEDGEEKKSKKWYFRLFAYCIQVLTLADRKRAEWITGGEWTKTRKSTEKNVNIAVKRAWG